MPPRHPGPDASRPTLRRYYQQTTEASLDAFLNARASARPPPSNAAVQGESGGQTGVHTRDLDDVGELQDRQHGRFVRQRLEPEEVADPALDVDLVRFYFMSCHCFVNVPTGACSPTG